MDPIPGTLPTGVAEQSIRTGASPTDARTIATAMDADRWSNSLTDLVCSGHRFMER